MSEPELVVLTPAELRMAAMIGVERHFEALKAGLPNRHGARPEMAWSLHIEGAAGEMVVAKVLGVHWEGTINTYKHGGDIGSALQVRTRSRHDFDLIVRKDDRDEDEFVLVTGVAPRYQVHGYIRGRRAKDARWLQEHGGREAAYFVPKAELEPLWKLQGLLEALGA
jgi:hypothetical protein